LRTVRLSQIAPAIVSSIKILVIYFCDRPATSKPMGIVLLIVYANDSVADRLVGVPRHRPDFPSSGKLDTPSKNAGLRIIVQNVPKSLSGQGFAGGHEVGWPFSSSLGVYLPYRPPQILLPPFLRRRACLCWPKPSASALG